MKRFAFIEPHGGNITSRGFKTWRNRPMSRRQRDDMVLFAQIREEHRLSSYGRPRMTEELKKIGFAVRHRRVGRLMRDNVIKVVRTRKYKVTTHSKHSYAIAPNLLDRNKR